MRSTASLEVLTRRHFVVGGAATLLIGSAVSPLTLAAPANPGPQTGKFIGELKLNVSERDGKALYTLENDFGYEDPAGKRWQAKKGLATDGATIPRILWPLVGHPFEGLYVKAAVIHDFYCIEKHRYREWQAVHHVFRDAMLTNGAPAIRAALMFFAVWRFGPRWKVSEIKPCTPGVDEFCASAEPTAYLIRSQNVANFSEATEKAHLQAIERELNAGRLKMDDIPAREAVLPTLARQERVHEVPAQSNEGWAFAHPYEFPLE